MVLKLEALNNLVMALNDRKDEKHCFKLEYIFL